MIEDVLYENILIDAPEQVPLWIGPAQQSDDQSNPCKANPCSLCWPWLPFSECRAPNQAFYRNVTLRNITINNPTGGYNGIILANGTDSPMQDILFEVRAPGEAGGLVRVVQARARALSSNVWAVSGRGVAGCCRPHSRTHSLAPHRLAPPFLALPCPSLLRTS